jgi:hypothetical protein
MSRIRRSAGQSSWCMRCSASWSDASERAASAFASCSATSRCELAFSCWARPLPFLVPVAPVVDTRDPLRDQLRLGFVRSSVRR